MAEKPQEDNNDEKVWYDEDLYKFKRQTQEQKMMNDADKEFEDIKNEYNHTRNRFYSSFLAIDTINVIKLAEKWQKDHGVNETPLSVSATLILEQKLVNWTRKYNKNPDNIEYLINKIINDKEECNVEMNK